MPTQTAILARHCPHCGNPFEVAAVRSYPLLADVPEFVRDVGSPPDRFGLICVDAAGRGHCSWDEAAYRTRWEADAAAIDMEEPAALEQMRLESEAEGFYGYQAEVEFYGERCSDDPHDVERPIF